MKGNRERENKRTIFQKHPVASGNIRTGSFLDLGLGPGPNYKWRPSTDSRLEIMIIGGLDTSSAYQSIALASRL